MIHAQHQLVLEPQPIADQWMAKCSCGWRKAASFYEYETKDQLLDTLREAHADHTDAHA